jgi:hypothetical protein
MFMSFFKKLPKLSGKSVKFPTIFPSFKSRSIEYREAQDRVYLENLYDLSKTMQNSVYTSIKSKEANHLSKLSNNMKTLLTKSPFLNVLF